MFVGSPKPLAVAGMALAAAFASPALAQSNPFVPASAASKASVEKIVEEKMRAMEERIIASVKQSNANDAAMPPVAGFPGAPGSPIGPPVYPGAHASGAAVPGGMLPPGAMVPGAPGGMPMGPIEPPKGAVEAARDNDVRFIGCINGVPKFKKQSGERVTFSKADIAAAVKSGLLPECR